MRAVSEWYISKPSANLDNTTFTGKFGSNNMCPVKKSYRTPHNRIKILVKEAKQMVNGPYYCPQCKKELLQILGNRDNKVVFVVCKCGLEEKLPYAPVFQPVDYYSKFMDIYKKRRYPVPPKSGKS